MQFCFVNKAQNAVPIYVITPQTYTEWLTKQSSITQMWLKDIHYLPQPGQLALIPDGSGKLHQVVCCVVDKEILWDVGHLPFALPEGVYTFAGDDAMRIHYAIAWGLGAYQFTRYKQQERLPAQLLLSSSFSHQQLDTIIDAIYWVRDCINTPTDDMGPSEFADVACRLAKEFSADFQQIVGEELLTQNYPSIYTVGRASDDAPRLLDLRWGDERHPKLTLVGKGVCFDSGGLDLKPSPYMLLMKKDMAGGAHVFGLARMIMQSKLPVRLRVLVPAVENVISGNAYRPGDIIKSRKGLTIEIGNTDAEGRVVLADALTEAVSEQPDLLIDITTLTGAARVALGTDLPAVFSNNEQLVTEVLRASNREFDPMWRLPLFTMYRELLNSIIADINNNTTESYAGAITAALFLKEFVPDDIPWLHFDMMAWNLRTRPGRPQGAEALTLRALFAFLSERYD